MTAVPSLPSFIEAQLPRGARRQLLSAGGVRVHVMEFGPADAAHTVWMQHGNPTWGFLYRKVVAALQADGGEALRIVLPDLVGLGYSDKPADAAVHTLRNHVLWIRTVIDQCVPGPLTFVGQDWGGPIGLGALAQLPGRLRGLVLLNTVAGPPRPGFKPTSFHRFAATPVVSDLVFRGLGLPQRALHLAQGDRGSIRGEVARAYVHPLRRWRDTIAPLAMARMVPNSQSHASIPELQRCADFVRSFDGPSAIVWGRRDPVIGRALKGVRKLLPDAPVTETQAGHFLQEEVPGEIARAIRDVIARTDGSG